MARLAILGHATRGKEVIEILEMLGGKNDNHCCGGFLNSIYFINNYGYIESCDRMQHLDYLQLTLEEFLELYPFKVEDKVLINDDENDVYTVKSMEWNECFNRVAYRIEAVDGVIHDNAWFASEMLLFNRKKEESMEEKGDKAKAPNLIGEDYSEKRYGYKIPNGYEFDCIINDEIILKPKQSQYPKTCEECCKILKIPTNGDIIYAGNWTWGEEYLDEHLDKIRNFQKLKICRDAYWKIVGEQMGLCEPWEPQFENCNIPHYCIFINHTGKVYKDCFYGNRCLLVFPTAEMRDAFYENFKDFIEKCKELL